MKKLIGVLLFATMLISALTTNSLAQRADDATVTANIILVQGLQATAEQNVSFGTAAAGQTGATIALDRNGYSAGSNAEGGSPGEIQITGAANQNVTINYSSSISLVGVGNGSNSVSYTPILYDENNTAINSSDEITLGSAETSIYVGGEVDIGGASQDTYEGSVTVDFTYTSI